MKRAEDRISKAYALKGGHIRLGFLAALKRKKTMQSQTFSCTRVRYSAVAISTFDEREDSSHTTPTKNSSCTLSPLFLSAFSRRHGTIQTRVSKSNPLPYCFRREKLQRERRDDSRNKTVVRAAGGNQGGAGLTRRTLR